MKPFSPPEAARFALRFHISTNSRATTTGSVQVHIGLCAPRMPTIRPYNAEKRRPKRPDIAEEISDFHRPLFGILGAVSTTQIRCHS